MRVGIELAQLVVGRSGGVVSLLEGLLPALFAESTKDSFWVYELADGYHLPVHGLRHVSIRHLPQGIYWPPELDRHVAADRIDVLFRCFPSDEPTLFPLRRQMVLIPDLQHEALPDYFDPVNLARRRMAFERAIDRAGALAVISEHTRGDIVARHPSTRADIVLTKPALTAEGRIEGARVDDAGDVPARPFFLFPANLWPHKNHRNLFEAFRLFLREHETNHSLVLTGDPTGWDNLREACSDLPVAHLGFVSPARLRALYAAADALVFFSLYEGFGLPLLEAFSHGTPALCSQVSSLPEVVGDAALVCDPTDVGAMARLMGRIVHDPELRAELVARGRDRLALFSWRTSAKSLRLGLSRLAAQPVDFGTLMTVVADGQGVWNRLAESEADRATRLELLKKGEVEAAARLDILKKCEKQLEECEADRAARLELLKKCEKQLEECEADRATRLELLEKSEADRATRLELLEKSEADRAARLEAIEYLRRRLWVTEKRASRSRRSFSALVRFCRVWVRWHIRRRLKARARGRGVRNG